MKEIVSYEVKEFIYESAMERVEHIDKMDRAGWVESGQVKKLKLGVNILDATDDDYDWYACFKRTVI